jgi:MFS family permease
MCGVPQTWDQGTAATVPSLPGFQAHFGLDSDADQVSTFVSIIYIGYAVGTAASFLLNNRIGRLWSYRVYVAIYIVGQLIAVFANNLAALYAARIITGIGIGSVTVIGPIALVEISPAEIRGILTSWYPVAVSGTLMVAPFCVYGIMLHIPTSRLQYQIAWFAPCIYMALCIVASFSLLSLRAGCCLSIDALKRLIPSSAFVACRQTIHAFKPRSEKSKRRSSSPKQRTT